MRRRRFDARLGRAQGAPVYEFAPRGTFQRDTEQHADDRHDRQDRGVRRHRLHAQFDTPADGFEIKHDQITDDAYPD